MFPNIIIWAHMKFHQLSILALAAMLSACGGGGSGSASGGGGSTVTPPPVVVPPPYTITPAILQASYVAGYPTTVTLTGRQTVAFTGNVYIKATVSADVVDPAIVITPAADATFTVAVKTSATAKAGHYTGNISINVCSDALCASPLAGAPFNLPYDIEVLSPEGGVTISNASALSPLPGAPDWATFQGNAQHTGYVPVTLTPSAFSARWKWLPPAVKGQVVQMSTIATGGGLIYMSTGGSFSSSGDSYIAAYRESDGSKVWSHSFADLTYPSTNPPAFDSGKVYISAGSQQSTAMFAFDAASGAQVFKSAMSSQWENYLAPTVFGGNVYSDGGSYGGLYSFNQVSGANNFFTGLPQYDSWSPAVDGSGIYAYAGGKLHVIDPATGSVLFQLSDPVFDWNGYDTNSAPVIAANGLVIAGNLSYPTSASTKNGLVGFDVLKRSVRWSAAGGYSGNPAYADGTVFAASLSSGKLEARSETDGAVVWSWTPPAGEADFTSDVLVTRNLVFVANGRTTYAIDRNTHASVWSYKAGGKLAMSANGVLYIQSASALVAINLK